MGAFSSQSEKRAELIEGSFPDLEGHKTNDELDVDSVSSAGSAGEREQEQEQIKEERERRSENFVEVFK